jgi:hypothetical protein
VELENNEILLIFKVTDTGIGIKKEDMSKLFNTFTQLGYNETSLLTFGVGLGLAISRNLCRAMGGDIDVVSTYGEGSTFIATIPQKTADRTYHLKIENPDKENILLYETREPYINSLAYSFHNLNIKYKTVQTHSDFIKEIAKGEYTYLFVASSLIEGALQTVRQIGSEIKTVLLAEYGSMTAKYNVRTMAMPVSTYSIISIIENKEM